MSDQLLGAVIGASAAILAQIVTSIIQMVLRNREIKLQKTQIRLDASRDFEGKRLAALEKIHAILSALMDNDISADRAYHEIRDLFFYISPALEENVRKAIRSQIPGSSRDNDRIGQVFASAFKHITDENRKNMEVYYE